MCRRGLCCLLFALLLFTPGGCRQHARAAGAERIPQVRVRLHSAVDRAMLAASHPATVSIDGSSRRVNFPRGEVPLTIAAGGWQIGNLSLGSTGELTLEPSVTGSIRINGQFHRGRYRFVHVGSGRFDIINDVDVESYLKGVLAREMPDRWNEESFKAQAIAARTYALFEARTSGGRGFDVYADTRSQVYAGLGAETQKSARAVEATQGVVVAYGPPGQERIFKAYFSSCCGGIGQSAVDAMGDSDIPPLREKNVGSLCNASHRFNWAPLVLRKDELTRRIRAWGVRRNHAVKDMSPLVRIDILRVNRFGRPAQFVLTDAGGARYSLTSEETRWACNAEAGGGPVLPSAFFRPVNETDSIRFVDGHGFGHGVGLCQWCTEALARRGMAHEDIVRHAYPGAVLVRAY